MKTGIKYFAAILLLLQLFSTPVQAQLNCPSEHQITAQFDNGSAWSMCWDSRKRENIVLSNGHFQPADQSPLKIFNSLRLSQLHVTYDDSNITYNDVTQFGLGGGFVSKLEPADCPDGTLLEIADTAGLCKQLSLEADSYITQTEIQYSQSLTLFSISQVGSYSYIVTWKFYSDGSIVPSIGAAGALQRSSDEPDSPYGRKLSGVHDKSWLSHTHNYYWKLDFDLGERADDDIVSEFNFVTDEQGRRSRNLVPLTIESARQINPQQMTSWTITDGDPNDPSIPGYHIEPINFGHRLINSVDSPYTEYDFFATRQRDCERFASENTKFNPACKDDVLQFVDGENLNGEDVVVWHRISFHHVPRNEDRHVMHSHWDGFVIKGRNLFSQSPDHSGNVSERTLMALAAAEFQNDQPEIAQARATSGCSLGYLENGKVNLELFFLVVTSTIGLLRRRRVQSNF